VKLKPTHASRRAKKTEAQKSRREKRRAGWEPADLAFYRIARKARTP
jgi:hypothetical protein